GRAGVRKQLSEGLRRGQYRQDHHRCAHGGKQRQLHGLERAGSIGHGQAEGAQGAQGGGFGGRGDADEDASYDQEDDDGQGQDILQGKRQALPDRHFFGLVSRGGVGIDQTSD